MTLVVGCAMRDIGFLVADTLLSFPFDLKGRSDPVNGEAHALKIQILNPTTAVAFAGDFGASIRLVKTLQEELDTNPMIDPFQLLSAMYRPSFPTTPAPDCEFLLLRIAPEGKRLARITNDGLFYCERAFIGDAAGYNKMSLLRQAHSMPAVRQIQQPDGTFLSEAFVHSKGEIEFEEVSRAMQALTERRQHLSIGAMAGCITRVVDARISGQLEYMQEGESSVSQWEGLSGFSFLASNSSIRGIGIYYRSGKFGFLFVVGDFQPCHREHAETLAQFIQVAKINYGLDLQGVTWNE